MVVFLPTNIIDYAFIIDYPVCVSDAIIDYVLNFLKYKCLLIYLFSVIFRCVDLPIRHPIAVVAVVECLSSGFNFFLCKIILFNLCFIFMIMVL